MRSIYIANDHPSLRAYSRNRRHYIAYKETIEGLVPLHRTTNLDNLYRWVAKRSRRFGKLYLAQVNRDCTIKELPNAWD